MLIFIFSLFLVDIKPENHQSGFKIEKSYQGGRLFTTNGIYYIELSPESKSFWDMGLQYGGLLKEQLSAVLGIYKQYYVEEHGAKYDEILNVAHSLYYKYTLDVQEMIGGISQASGISLEDCIVLSAMQFISPYFVPDHGFDFHNGQCSFLSVAGDRTSSGKPLLGRFFDLFKPFEKVVEYLTVVKFPAMNRPNDEKRFFMVGFPGEIQCLTCFNEDGIFLEVNNGGASGGKIVYWDREFMPARFMQIIQASIDFYQMYYQLNSIRPDFSWIVNFQGPPTHVGSIEFSSKQDTLKSGFIEDDFVITNFFVNETWKNIPKPTDKTTWHGVTRRNNLISLLKALPTKGITVEMLQTQVMDIKMESGGALWNETVYQCVYDPDSLSLAVRAPHVNSTWSTFSFKNL